MLENKQIKGIHISRYLVSYISQTGIFAIWQFEDWLRTLVLNDEKLSEDEIREIIQFAAMGKLELETAAKSFAEKNTNEHVICY